MIVKVQISRRWNNVKNSRIN